jgi:hypothetical protein
LLSGAAKTLNFVASFFGKVSPALAKASGGNSFNREDKLAKRQYHLAKMDQKKKDKIAAGLVSERFPEVSGMVINMTYYQKVANPVLMVRTLNVFPTDYAYFLMECALKDCVDGGFDLTPVISVRWSAAGKMTSCPPATRASLTKSISITGKRDSPSAPRKAQGRVAGRTGAFRPGRCL